MELEELAAVGMAPARPAVAVVSVAVVVAHARHTRASGGIDRAHLAGTFPTTRIRARSGFARSAVALMSLGIRG